MNTNLSKLKGVSYEQGREMGYGSSHGVPCGGGICFSSRSRDSADTGKLGAPRCKNYNGTEYVSGLGGFCSGPVHLISALLGGGPDNYYKNIVVAMMPAVQGIYSIVVFIIDRDQINTDPYTVAGRAAIFGICMFLCGWYQGIVSAAGVRGILERKTR